MPTAGPGALPNLIVIGAQKCGTSSLHYYLGLHPEIEMSRPKELDFFVDTPEPDGELAAADPRERALFSGGRSSGSLGNWARGTDWYASRFRGSTPVRGESSPSYSAPWFPRTAERMASVVPNAKLVYLIRDPVQRMLSHHAHLSANRVEWRPPEEALAAPGNVYLARTRYGSILRRFLEHYDRERILVLRQEDLLERRRETVAGVYRFAGVDASFWSPKIERERNLTAAKGARSRAIRRLQRSPLASVANRLPQEAKWKIERLSARRDAGNESEGTISDGLRRALVAQLRGEIEAMEELSGVDLSRYRRSDAPK